MITIAIVSGVLRADLPWPEVERLLADNTDTRRGVPALGGFMPYPAMADLARLALAATEEGRADRARAILRLVDEFLRNGDPQVRNLASVGFLEELRLDCEDEAVLRAMVDLMPPAVREEYEAVQAH